MRKVLKIRQCCNDCNILRNDSEGEIVLTPSFLSTNNADAFSRRDILLGSWHERRQTLGGRRLKIEGSVGMRCSVLRRREAARVPLEVLLEAARRRPKASWRRSGKRATPVLPTPVHPTAILHDPCLELKLYLASLVPVAYPLVLFFAGRSFFALLRLLGR